MHELRLPKQLPRRSRTWPKAGTHLARSFLMLASLVAGISGCAMNVADLRVAGVVWQIDNATLDPRGHWDRIGATELLIQWTAVDGTAFVQTENLPVAARLPDWKRIAGEPWARDVILGLAGRFDEREMLAADLMTLADVMKMANPEAPKPADDYQRYVAEETAAGRQPLDRIGFSNALKGNGVTQTIRNPDGSETTIQVGGAAGASGGGKPLTESQAKLTVFQTDMTQAAEVLTQLEQSYDPTNMQDATAGILGDKWGSFLQTSDGQIYRSAAMQWLDSGIRIRTGAAATEGEVARQYTSMFPQPGDEPRTVEYKRRARENFQRSVDAALKGVRDPITPAAPDNMLAPSDKEVGNTTSTGGAAVDMSDDDFLKVMGLE